MQMDRLRPEFRSGLDALTKFVFERTRPKQVGATIMTGPILVGITESYLDALNNGAVPTISSSWQVCISIILWQLFMMDTNNLSACMVAAFTTSMNFKQY